jgi:hypothetical protein
MKTALKCKNYEFLVMALKYVQTVIFLINLHGTPKQWAIAQKTALKCKNDEFLEMALKYVKTIIFLVNLHGTPKQWAIAHNNGPKMC